MRKIILGLAAATALAAPLAVAGSANAAVAVDNGIGHVDKGDVQSALVWNNKAFDDGVKKLKFTVGAEKVVVDYPMTCFNLNTGAQTSGGHRLIVQPGTATVAAAPIYNAGNGKQITGFNLTGTVTDFTNVGNRVSRDVTCGTDTVLFMNEGTPAQPNTVSVTGGLQVNGVPLPNTPIAPIV